jgi:hypothetical protein
VRKANSEEFFYQRRKKEEKRIVFFLLAVELRFELFVEEQVYSFNVK